MTTSSTNTKTGTKNHPTVLFGYQVIARYGSGRLGDVYVGRRGDTLRALFQPRLEVSLDDGFQATWPGMLDRIVGLDSPYLCKCMQANEKGGAETALLLGTDLDAWLEKQTDACAPQTAANIVAQVALGTAELHAMGLVHTHIAAHNVTVLDHANSEVPRVVLRDAGLAAAIASSKDGVTNSMRVPRVYASASPEEIDGGSSSSRSDVFALGLLLYEVLLGHYPYVAKGKRVPKQHKALMLRIKATLPDLATACPTAPSELVAIALKATAANPNERFADAGELAAALQAEAPSSGVSGPYCGRLSEAPPPQPSWEQIRPRCLEQLDPSTSTLDAPATATSTTGATAPVARAADAPIAALPSFAPPAAQPNAAPPTPTAAAPTAAAPPAKAPLPKAPQAAQPDADDDDDLVNKTRFALPTFAPSGAPAVVAEAEKPKSRRLLVAGILFFVVVGGAAGGYFLLREKPKKAVSNVVANTWIPVLPPESRPVALGIDKQYEEEKDASGFRPARKVVSPPRPYAIQQHEVTWSEFFVWFTPKVAKKFPGFKPKKKRIKKDALPVQGATWAVARAYCEQLKARLPTEEEWEFAARGENKKLFPWGTNAIDISRTNAFQGKDGAVKKVMKSSQDRTPGKTDAAIYDLMGNVQEWTMDIWREDTPNQDESWTQREGVTFRALRGFPLYSQIPKRDLVEGVAHRETLCATGPCPKSAKNLVRGIGFRCVRDYTPPPPKKKKKGGF